MISQLLTFGLGIGWLLLLSAPFEFCWEVILFFRWFKWPKPFDWNIPLSVALVVACFLVWTLLAIMSWLEQIHERKAEKAPAGVQRLIGSL